MNKIWSDIIKYYKCDEFKSPSKIITVNYVNSIIKIIDENIFIDRKNNHDRIKFLTNYLPEEKRSHFLNLNRELNNNLTYLIDNIDNNFELIFHFYKSTENPIIENISKNSSFVFGLDFICLMSQKYINFNDCINIINKTNNHNYLNVNDVKEFIDALRLINSGELTIDEVIDILNWVKRNICFMKINFKKHINNLLQK